MIALRRLIAERFKGLLSVDLRFPERGSILIEGHNEAGKSTLFEAIYVALYGEPLIGEESRARVEEVIAHGQERASVELTVAVGAQELVVRRTFQRSRQQVQQATLTIRRPGATPETINRIRAVNERILKELGGLNGDSLRNSCFVEQQELGRLESLSRAEREQAVNKLLGLGRLTALAQRFRYTREQERALQFAVRRCELAQMQDEVARLAAEVVTLQDRRDAAQVAAHLHERAGLRHQAMETQRNLDISRASEAAARAGLERCADLRGVLSGCERADEAMDALRRTREALTVIEAELAEIDRLAQTEAPQTRELLGQVEEAIAAALQVDEAVGRVGRTAEALRAANEQVEALRRAEATVKQSHIARDTAASRHTRHIEDARMRLGREQQRIDEILARRDRLTTARGPVQAWESAGAEEDRVMQAIDAARATENRIIALRGELSRREQELNGALAAASAAERDSAVATARVQQATVRAALQAWVRLKGVEERIATYTGERAALEVERAAADAARDVKQQRSRTLGLAAGGAGVGAVLAAAAGLAVPPLFTVAALLVLASSALGVMFGRARADAMRAVTAYSALDTRVRDLDVAYQATIQTGGDPAALAACEATLRGTSAGVPASLDEAQACLAAEANDDTDDLSEVHERARAASAHEAATHARLEQARRACDETRGAIVTAEQATMLDAVARLEEKRVTQRMRVEEAEQVARLAIGTDLPWPVETAGVDAALLLCDREAQAARGALAEQEREAAAALAISAADVREAERAQGEAERVAAGCRAADPEGALVQAQAAFATSQEAEAAARSRLTPLAERAGITPERSALEGERGRVGERMQVLERRLATRENLAERAAQQEKAVAEALEAARQAVTAVVTALRPLREEGTRGAIELVANAGEQHAQSDAGSPIELLERTRVEAAELLASIDEAGLQAAREIALHDTGVCTQHLQMLHSAERDLAAAINALLAAHGLVVSDDKTVAQVVEAWPLVAAVAAADLPGLVADLEDAEKRLYAAQERVSALSSELDHDGTLLDLVACREHVAALRDDQAICGQAMRAITEAQERIARHVLPTTERNMQLLLPQLTSGRYHDVRLTAPESEDGQPGAMDYRIRVWDPMAGRYVAKNLFSGGTRDQCSLALRLAFALATLPQELGVAPGFIILDEPLTAFDAERAQALVALLTTGTIAEQFEQVIVISHGHAFDRSAFAYHVVMEHGRVRSTSLPAGDQGLVVRGDDEEDYVHVPRQSPAQEPMPARLFPASRSLDD